MNVGQHAGFPQDWSWQPAVVGFAFCFNIEQILTNSSNTSSTAFPRLNDKSIETLNDSITCLATLIEIHTVLVVGLVYSSAVSETSTKDDNAHCHASEEKLKFSKATSVQLSR
uniref:Uncharacterized protein n=1 Tax=Vespula pensylvanica TaxID=30213 RepID=A0A834U4T7_VESPE|nr:hypothetical protein H0235_011114 [Vespula pensylvanica]